MNRILLLAVVLVAACKDSKPKTEQGAPAAAAKPAAESASDTATPTTKRPASITNDHVATADNMIATLQELGTALDKAANCAEMTKALEAASPKFAAIGPAMQKTIAETSADPAASAWFEANYATRTREAATPFMAKAATCKDDPAFMTALSQMPMMKKKQ